MSDVRDPEPLVERLVRLGDALDLHDPAPDDTALVDVVLSRIESPAGSSSRPGWLIAAVILAVLAAAVFVHPDSRAVMARWLGLDGVAVEVDPDLSLPAPSGSFDVPGPGESEVVMVDGREVLVSAVDGSFDERLIRKTVTSSEQVRQVQVMEHPALWITGDAHEVMYESADGEVIVERVAADTLLWQDGAVLYRVEGFDDLADALAFAEGT